VIVGAGLAGLSVSHALVRRGVTPLVVAPDHGESACGAGILSLQFWDRALGPLARRSREIVRGLVPVHRCPMAQIALGDRTARRLDAIEGAREGLPRGLAARLAPAFRRRIARAVHSRDDLWVRPAVLLRALGRGARRVRARVRAIEAGRVRTDRGSFEAERIVLAAGPWTPRLAPGLGLERRRAQLARVEVALPAMLHVLDTGLYLRPDGAGGALAGDGDAAWRGEPDARSARATARFLARLRRELGGVLGAAPRVVGAGGGVILRTRDRRPVARRLGPALWVVTGFGGDGLPLAPAVGERVADALLDRP
jgi:sarcosine oxidase subunit beta